MEEKSHKRHHSDDEAWNPMVQIWMKVSFLLCELEYDIRPRQNLNTRMGNYMYEGKYLSGVQSSRWIVRMVEIILRKLLKRCDIRWFWRPALKSWIDLAVTTPSQEVCGVPDPKSEFGKSQSRAELVPSFWPSSKDIIVLPCGGVENANDSTWYRGST